MLFATLLYSVYFVVGCLVISNAYKTSKVPALVYDWDSCPWDTDLTNEELMQPFSPVEANFNALMSMASEVAEDTSTEVSDDSSDLQYRISKYEARSLAGLRELAKGRGMKGYSTLRKAELAERLAQDDVG